jgi:catechol 2,3-dioxygenase-like lactoylglutathione lyase family enzyme
MKLVDGVHHLTFLTEDIDRLAAFYERVFERGRLDHFAFSAPSEEAFREIRRRIESEAAADGGVRDMKTMWIMAFHDPDGFYVEVIWRKPGVPDAETLPRADWTTVELS